MAMSEAEKLIQLEKQEAVLKRQRDEYKKIAELNEKGKASDKERLKLKQEILKNDKEVKKLKSEINKEDKDSLSSSKISLDYSKNLAINLKKINADKKTSSTYTKDIAVQESLAVGYGKKASESSGRLSETYEKMAGFSSDLNDLQLQSLKNESLIGTEKFKEVDIEKLREQQDERKLWYAENRSQMTKKEQAAFRRHMKLQDQSLDKEEKRSDKMRKQNDMAKEMNKNFMKGLDKITGFISKIPGGGFLLRQIGLDEKGMKKVKEGMGKAFGSLVKGDIRGAVKGVGTAFKGVNVGVLAGAAAVMAFTMAWKGVAGVIDEIGAELGAVGVTQFRDDFVGIFEETAGWNVSIKEAMSGIRVLSDEFGVGFDYAEDLVGKTKELALSLGMSQAEAAKVMGTFMTIGGLTADQAVQLSKQTELLAVANDVAPAGVMKDVAENTEFFAKYGKDGGKNIAEAAVQAKKLGSNLGTVEKVMSSLLDWVEK
jgi:hypothetical protein